MSKTVHHLTSTLLGISLMTGVACIGDVHAADVTMPSPSFLAK
jgi:hypothetical protein